MDFQNIVKGKVSISDLTVLTFKGREYRGKSEIMELAKAQVGSQEVTTNGNDTEPGAKPGKTKKVEPSATESPTDSN
jgi:hypothetical protein